MVALLNYEPSRPARLARRYIDKLHLKPPVDVLAVAAACGVPVLEQPPGGPPDDAFLAYYRATGRWAIFVNPGVRDPLRRRFTLAHEIGHYILHRQQIQAAGHAGADLGWMEEEAHEFARELLLPAEDVLFHAHRGLADWQVRSLYGVSMAAWYRRLADLGINIHPRFR